MNVFITDAGFSDVNTEREIIEGAGHTLHLKQCKTEEDLLNEVTTADALIVQWAPVSAKVIEALKQCKVIVRYGIGVDNVDLEAAKEKGIPVCNIPDYCIEEVADHALSMAFALSRQLPQTTARLRTGEWKITPPAPILPTAQTLFATAGFGRIAQMVLSKAKALGFNVAACDPYCPEEVIREKGVQSLNSEELFQKADILSLHLPLTKETHYYINKTTLAQMKQGSILVNTSRGGLVDIDALSTSLENHHLGGAGLDVFSEEPPEVSHPLFSSNKVILTSHTAWNSTASVPKLQKLAAEEAIRGLSGDTFKNKVN
ncbi:MAG: C-terminal binding protein [Opitutaceae bacterium]|nr:C-terminal binding protein [Opitutaceae bacterium]